MLNEIPNGEFEELDEPNAGLPPEFHWPAAARIAVQIPDGRWLFGTFRHAWPDEQGGWVGMTEEGEHDYWIPNPQPQGVPPQGRDWQHTLTYHSKRNPEGAAGAFRLVPFTDDPVRIENGRVIDMATPDPDYDERNPAPGPVTDIEVAPPRQGAGMAANAHYRNAIRWPATPEDAERGYVRVILDPYRLARALEVGGGPREQLLKKTMRGQDKGETERQLAEQCLAAVQRWIEMLDEEDEGVSFDRGGV